MITIDFEARSVVDLLKCGAYKYSIDPSTEVLCMAFKFPEVNEPWLWHPAFPELGLEESEASGFFPGEVAIALQELFDRIEAGEEIEAHNAFFERCIWTNIMVPRYGWPAVNPKQWRCSASRASMCALPRDLDGATRALGLPVDKQKSKEGKALMLRMCKPAKPSKAQMQQYKILYDDESEWPIVYHESPDMIYDLGQYCMQDTIAEEALSNALPPLPDTELSLWQIDQAINWHGVYFDRHMVEQALKYVDISVDRLNRELIEITNGVLKAGTQRAALLKYVNERAGLEIPDTKGKTLTRALKDEKILSHLDTVSKRVIEICIDINRSSTAKYKSMLQRMVPDQYLRDLLMYHGAGTGRWTGKGIQPHNFPRGKLKPKAAMMAAELICNGEFDKIDLLWDGSLSSMEILSSCLRGAIRAAPGKELVVADYSSIEARVLVWLVGDKKALDIFSSGKDIYIDMASAIYGIPYDQIGKDSEERRMGKQAILGLGYQMGHKKFKATLWDQYDIVIETELAERVVNAYRERYAKVKAFWYEIERCALLAMKNKGKVVRCGPKLLFKFSKGFLRCRLPSGRMLYYRDPKIMKKTLPWGVAGEVLTYMTVDGQTKKWVRTETYGGKLTENVVQAIARDFMGYGIKQIEQHGKYELLISIHDELLAECPEGTGDVEEFEKLMATLPAWGKGCPVAAEGWKGIRYRK